MLFVYRGWVIWIYFHIPYYIVALWHAVKWRCNVTEIVFKLHSYIFVRYLLLKWECRIGKLNAEMAKSENLINADYHKQVLKYGLWNLKLKHADTHATQCHLTWTTHLFCSRTHCIAFVFNMAWNIYLVHCIQILSFYFYHPAVFETVILSVMEIHQPLLLSDV